MAELETSAKKGRLEGLEALRDVLAQAILSDEDGKQTAALARQLRDVLRDVDELKRATKKGSVVDELANRRSSRIADTPGDAPAKRVRKKRGS